MAQTVPPYLPPEAKVFREMTRFLLAYNKDIPDTLKGRQNVFAEVQRLKEACDRVVEKLIQVDVIAEVEALRVSKSAKVVSIDVCSKFKQKGGRRKND